MCSADARKGALVYIMTTPVAPLQVEVLAEPGDPDFTTTWKPGPDGIRIEIHGLPERTYVHFVRLWDSSPDPVLLGRFPVCKVVQDGDVITVGALALN